MKVTKSTLSVLQAIMAAAIVSVSMWSVEAAGVGWVSWGVGVPPLLIIIITAIARAYDIQDQSFHGFTRKMGMVLVAASAASLLISPLLGYNMSFPLWRQVMLYWGVALTWITTPNLPPWWKYVSGEYKLKKGEQV